MRKVAFVALFLFVFALPWERNIGIPGIGAFGSLLGLIAMVLTVVSLIQAGALKLRIPSVYLVLMFAFVLWSALSYFWSIESRLSVSRIATYTQLFLMAWLVWELCRTADQRRALIQAYVLGGYFAISAMAADVALGRTHTLEFSSERYSFAGGDPNYLAAGLALGIPLAWHLYLRERTRVPGLLFALYVPIAIVAIGLTGSRGGMLTALVAVMIVPITFWHLGWWRRLLVLGSLSAVLYAGFLVIPSVNIERFSRVSENLAEGDLAGREGVYRASLELLMTDRMAAAIGTGSGTFPVAVIPFLGRPMSSHSAYLSIWVTLGGVGLLLFLAMFAVAIGSNLLGRGSHRHVAFILGASLMVAIAPVSWDNQKILWFMLVLLTTFSTIVLPMRDPVRSERHPAERLDTESHSRWSS